MILHTGHQRIERVMTPDRLIVIEALKAGVENTSIRSGAPECARELGKIAAAIDAEAVPQPAVLVRGGNSMPTLIRPEQIMSSKALSDLQEPAPSAIVYTSKNADRSLVIPLDSNSIERIVTTGMIALSFLGTAVAAATAVVLVMT